MVRMRIVGLSMDGTTKNPLLLLQEEYGDNRILPIWIGSMEAMSISLALGGKHLPRPVTHDLILDMVKTLGGTIRSIEINDFDKGTFYTHIVILHGEDLERVDCRPSDGIALAVKLNMPIYIRPDALEAAIDAEQNPDAASLQAFREHGNATIVQQEKPVVVSQEKPTVVQQEKPTIVQQQEAPAKKRSPRIQHITMTVQPKAHVKTLINGTSEGEEDADFEKLLKSLEPASNTRM